MAHIFAFMTATRVKWEQDEEGNTYEDPIMEHGWVDPNWSMRVLYENRNDVRPVINEDESYEDLPDLIAEALDELKGGYEYNGRGTFYAREPSDPYGDEWSYSYALHFTRKFNGKKGWVEEPFNPMEPWTEGARS